MKYIVDNFKGEEFWMELDDRYALRQIIISDEEIQISCITDCLAEGTIISDTS